MRTGDRVRRIKDRLFGNTYLTYIATEVQIDGFCLLERQGIDGTIEYTGDMLVNLEPAND